MRGARGRPAVRLRSRRPCDPLTQLVGDGGEFARKAPDNLVDEELVGVVDDILGIRHHREPLTRARVEQGDLPRPGYGDGVGRWTAFGPRGREGCGELSCRFAERRLDVIGEGARAVELREHSRIGGKGIVVHQQDDAERRKLLQRR